MEAFANQVVDELNGLLWGKILIWLLVGCGIWFTLRLGFIQVRHLGHTFTVLRGSRQSDASASLPSRRCAPRSPRAWGPATSPAWRWRSRSAARVRSSGCG